MCISTRVMWYMSIERTYPNGMDAYDVCCWVCCVFVDGDNEWMSVRKHGSGFLRGAAKGVDKQCIEFDENKLFVIMCAVTTKSVFLNYWTLSQLLSHYPNVYEWNASRRCHSFKHSNRNCYCFSFINTKCVAPQHRTSVSTYICKYIYLYSTIRSTSSNPIHNINYRTKTIRSIFHTFNLAWNPFVCNKYKSNARRERNDLCWSRK